MNKSSPEIINFRQNDNYTALVSPSNLIRIGSTGKPFSVIGNRIDAPLNILMKLLFVVILLLKNTEKSAQGAMFFLVYRSTRNTANIRALS